MALDESNDNDEIFDADGFTFCIEKPLVKQVSFLRVDITYMGFVVDSDMQLASSGGSCGSSCGVGGCGN